MFTNPWGLYSLPFHNICSNFNLFLQLVLFVTLALIGLDGIWEFDKRDVVELGSEPIACLVSVDHEMWAGFGCQLGVVSVATHYKGDQVNQVINKVNILIFK